jgi:hypothetical protein
MQRLGACRTYLRTCVARPKNASARREAPPISRLSASRATQRTRFLGSNPKGRQRFGSGSALLGLAIGALLPRPRALNRTQIARRRMRESKPDRLPAPGGPAMVGPEVDVAACGPIHRSNTAGVGRGGFDSPTRVAADRRPSAAGTMRLATTIRRTAPTRCLPFRKNAPAALRATSSIHQRLSRRAAVAARPRGRPARPFVRRV